MNIFDKLKETLNDKSSKAKTFLDENVTKENIDKLLAETKKTTDKVMSYTEDKLTEGYEVTKNYTNKQIEQYKKSKEPINEYNWYSKAAQICEELNDSILREDKGTSTKITKALVGKVGVTGTSIGIFSLLKLY